MHNTEEIWRLVDAKQDEFNALSDRVWEIPELCYGEFKSCAEHTAMLREQGFRVTENVAGIPTAVMGEAGEDGPVIAILGEYDALPGLSQEAGIAEPRPLPGAGFGHGCGHNMLGAASLLAATAVKDYLAAHGVKGRVRYYGCPAEEGGAAKGFMVRAGVFSDVDIAISWHPGAFAGLNEPLSLANTRIDFAFTGRASHAAASPHLGRSALDAVELMNVGVNYMREHMPSDARVHYAILDAGGIAPNVVQAFAKVRYLIRARNLPELTRLIERVRKIAEGAALMTETSVKATVISAVSNLLGNTPLEREAIVPLDAPRVPMVGSTDVGDVSWVVPLVQARGATYAIGTPGHSWQLTAQGKLPAAHKGLVHVAKVMAGTALDAIQDETLRARAKADLKARTARTPYVCPIPDEVEPPLQMSA